MIGFVLLGLAIVLGFIELVSLRDTAAGLGCDCSCDLSLAEPGEVITASYSVFNRNPWPVLFVSFALYLPDGAEICEDEGFISRHVRSDAAGTSVNHRLFLLPHRRYSGRVRFSLGERGVHRLGRAYVEAGDFLGIKSAVSSIEPEVTVLCTAKNPGSEPVLRVLGGWLGDISVRRFIYEDPSLVIGYRDYTGREPMKSISWVQTARLGRLTVKEQDFTTDANVAVLAAMQEGPDSERAFELLRTVCEELEARDIPYELRTNGDLMSVPEGLGRSHLRAVLRRIALSRSAVYTSFAETADALERKRRTGRSFIVVTDRETEEIRAAARALEARSGAPVLVLCANEQ